MNICTLEECLCCKKKNLKCILDLGFQPLANDFHELNLKSINYPLKLMYCNSCFHCQLSHIVKPELLFKDYKYLSGTSQTGHNFFKVNAEYIHSLHNNTNKNILDIACNDGTQLDYFKALGWNTYGVDPAENIYTLSRNKGHTIICGFWNDICASQLPIMNVIIAQNVFAHTSTPDCFLLNCKKLMNADSSLYIQTSQRDMIKNCEFDTIYHEHISFFNTKSMQILVEKCGLVLNRVLENTIHGRSYIFEIKMNQTKTCNVNEIMTIEETEGLYSPSIYTNFQLNTNLCVKNLSSIIDNYRKTHKCIGFGAAAKGQTLICYGNIELSYIIDENPLKIGLFSPKQNIPIVDMEHFIKDDSTDKFLMVLLAWNFSEEIIRKIKNLKLKKEIIVIERYFPEVKIIII